MNPKTPKPRVTCVKIKLTKTNTNIVQDIRIYSSLLKSWSKALYVCCTNHSQALMTSSLALSGPRNLSFSSKVW